MTLTSSWHQRSCKLFLARGLTLFDLIHRKQLCVYLMHDCVYTCVYTCIYTRTSIVEGFGLDVVLSKLSGTSKGLERKERVCSIETDY